MQLLHPPIAPWCVRVPEGCEITLLVRSDAPVQAFLRHLPDNEEELLPLQPAGQQAGWACYRGLLPWDGGNEVTRYCFKLLAGGHQRWLGADGVHPRVPTEQQHFRVNREHRPPAWVRDQVFYQVFPDRFARGGTGPLHLPPSLPGQPANEARAWGEPVPADRPGTVFYGGDLPGLTQRLGYLRQELGVTALYLNPIFRSRSNHKYDTESYEEVDAGFGGNQALARLREATHERGMRMVLDAVVNHTGAQHPWFQEGSRWRGRYAVDAQGRPRGWKGYESLPVLDYGRADVKQAMFEAPDSVMRRWLQPPYAIDGWRLDAVHMLGEGLGARNNAGVLREMRRAVKAHNAQAYLVGEHFFEATSWLQGDQEDGAMNYHGFAHPLRAWLAGLDIAYQPIVLSTEDFAAWLREAMAALPYENQLAQLNLLDSHDTQRFLTLLGNDVAAMQIAVTLLMSFPGTPCVYYGDEIGLLGGPDPDCRRCFDWERAHWNHALFEHYRAAIARRHARAELREGAFVQLHAEGDVYAFARFTAQAASVIAVNRGRTACTLAVDLSHLPVGGGKLTLEVPARGSTVWSSSSQ
ncbi:MAG: maltodextrin glucosidase [Pseudomonadota bacterium]